MKNSPAFTPQNFLNTLKVMFFAIVFAVIAISAVFVVTTPNQHFKLDLNSGIFVQIIPAAIVLATFFSSVMFQKFVGIAQKKETLKDKLILYRTAIIIRLALLEGVAILSSVAFMIEHNQLFLIFTLVVVILMLMNFPNQQKIEEHLKLTGDELSRFRDFQSEIQ